MTDWLTNSNASASRASQRLGRFAASSRVASHQIAEIIGSRENATGLQMIATLDQVAAGYGSPQLGATKMAAHERYCKISFPAWESRFQHTDEHAGSNSATICPVGDPDLNDPQILLLELAHGMLVDTETCIDCPYRYWRVAQVPGRRSADGAGFRSVKRDSSDRRLPRGLSMPAANKRGVAEPG